MRKVVFCPRKYAGETSGKNTQKRRQPNFYFPSCQVVRIGTWLAVTWCRYETEGNHGLHLAIRGIQFMPQAVLSRRNFWHRVDV